MPTILLLCGITLVGLALRLPSFSDSLWGDEVGTNYVVNGFGVGSVLHIVGTDQEGTPPLFFMLTWLTKGFDGTEGYRVVSLLAGLGAIPLTYVLGLRTVGRTAGILAALLIALDPFQIFYSTEARAYELVMFCCLLATVALLKALDSGGWAWWVAYCLSAAAALYTHYNAVFVLAVLFAWAFLTHPSARLKLAIPTLGAAILFAPWLPEFIEDSDEPAAKLTGLLHPLSLPSAKNDVLQWGAGVPNIPVADLPGHPALWLGIAALVIGAAALLLRLRAEPLRAWDLSPVRAALPFALALAAPVGALIWSLLSDSIFVPRALIASWPGLAVSLAAVVALGRSPVRIVATCLLIGAYGVGAAMMLDPANQRPDYAGVVDFIESSGPPDAPVVDGPQPSPGPQTNLEAAFASKGQPLPTGRRILTLNAPTFQTLITARKEGVGILVPHPTPSPQQIAREASRLAGDGKLFLVNWGTATLSQLRSYPGPAADFLDALPPRFHEVESRTFPGPWIGDESVHVLDGASSSAG
jgi:Dolichyl-phosphate-mannose-protein mannosyltransferase